MAMSACKHCQDPIVFGFDPVTDRWSPLNPESLVGTEQRVGRSGVVLEPHHRRHECDLRKRFFKRVAAAPTKESPRPPTPPRAPPRVVASGSFRWNPESGELWSPHAVLFLIPGAPIEVIRAAHRALAAIHHPDRGGDPSKMVEINLAYDVLKRT
jgi:hypothetical protein